jgi:23S rRNA (adenine2503-C2)-methyltransferase
MNTNQVRQWLTKHGYPGYRFDQYMKAVLKGASSWSEVTGWPQNVQTEIALDLAFLSYTKSEVWESTDGTKKAKLTLKDGLAIETVLMQPKPGMISVCVSCEVGCPMGCAFCATGSMGLKRVLTAEEIVDEWHFWLTARSDLSKGLTLKPTNLVFMGMGEPMHNQSNVFAAIQILHDTYDLGWRKMSVSTCGIAPGIIALAHTYPQINLAISLHAATESVRLKLMPVANAYSLKTLQKTLLDYLNTTSRQIMFEYILLAGVNDRLLDQTALIEWLKPFPSGLVHVNLIRYNPTNSNYHMPEKDQVTSWKDSLLAAGISTSIRKNLGTDIFGACGQLITQNPTS